MTTPLCSIGRTKAARLATRSNAAFYSFSRTHQTTSAAVVAQCTASRWRCIHTTPTQNSGHNRWSKIRHRKGAADAQKSVQFSRITTEIYLSLRAQPSADPSVNPRLAAILSKARDVGYPKANVDAAIHRALNPNENARLQSVTYEAIGPGGAVAFMIEALTDNTNRTTGNVRERLAKYGARMSSCAFQFERKGLIKVRPRSKQTLVEGCEGAGDEETFERVFDMAVEAGAEDVRLSEDEEGTVYQIITPPAELNEISKALQAIISPTDSSSSSDSNLNSDLFIESIELAYLAPNPLLAPAEDGQIDAAEESGETISEEVAEKTANLVDSLEEVDDVVKVWTNVKDF